MARGSPGHDERASRLSLRSMARRAQRGSPAGPNRAPAEAGSGPETMLENEFLCENNVLLRATSVAESRDTNRPRSKPVHPKPFTVYQSIPGQNAKLIFTVCAYSLAQARAI